MEKQNEHQVFQSNGNLRDVRSKRIRDDYPIIVHSHLNWDWVWQRPQQFMSRLSQGHRILFVEGPTPSSTISATEKTLCGVSDYPNILVIQTRIPAKRWQDGDWVDQERRRIVQQVLAEPLGREFEAPVQWFYDPMAVVAFAGHLNERAIVYDCMDELSLFHGAPPELVRRERELLTLADIVFAGGPQIWDAKRKLNPNCFCFGCGVDNAHFGKARQQDLPLPPEVENLPQPIFGYIGVVDERLDYDLIASVADAISGSVVIVGPSTKVDPKALPRRGNLHWLGARNYAELPDYARSFAACLMPFALNDATRFINPTKALEYMSTGRPIVSTSIADVVRQFRDVVHIAGDRDEFIAACQSVARLADPERIRKGLALAADSSWESVVDQLERRIEARLAAKFDLNVDAA